MRSLASDRVAAGLFAAMLIASVSLKALIGPPVKDAPRSGPGLIEAQTVRSLEAQGFSTKVQDTRLHGFIVFAAKGDCRLSVRDARKGPAEMLIYERDAAPIGKVRYLIAGSRYESPPTLALLMAKIETKVIQGLGLSGNVPVAVALATSSACQDRDFGLNPELPV